MILQALVKRYEDTATVRPGWQKRAVSYALDIAADGRLLGIVPLERREDSKTVKREFVLPEPPVRSSGIAPAFMCDNEGYFLGLDEKRGAEKFSEQGKLHHRLLDSVPSDAASAVLAYFDRAPQSIEGDDIADNSLCVFLVNGQFAHEDSDIIDRWDAQYASQGGGTARCLVTGQEDEIEPTHGKVRLRGGQSSGSNLVSANAESFTSYGQTAKDPAASVGKYAAFAYVAALNELLRDEKHRQFVGGDTLVYWAEGGEDEAEARMFSWAINPKEGDNSQLNGIVSAIVQGKSPDIEGIVWSKPFHLLCLSPNAARISVRFFYTSSFGSVLEKIIEHYCNLEIYSSRNEKFEHLPYWILLSETTVKGSASDAQPLLGGQLLDSIISGTRYPAMLLSSVITRIRAGGAANRAKAAVIKAVLIRNYGESEVTDVALNPESDNKPYVLGRLFAVLEQLQVSALGGSLNATIRDRYFASACANPGSVFPTLLRLSMHHAAKSDYAARYEKLKEDVLARLDVEAPFPAALSLEDQGRFILGYYHQTQDFFTKKQTRHQETEEDTTNV
jgi:CRISPR-associated protein Csd1